MFPPAVLAWEAFQKVTLIAPRLASEASKGFNGEELGISLGCHQIYPQCISTPPQWQMGRDGSGIPASVRDRLTLARKGSLGGRPVSIPS